VVSTSGQENKMKLGKIFSINVSSRRGVAKERVESANLVENLGIEGDAHAAPGIRQISLLAIESIGKQGGPLAPGDFAENITTQGFDLAGLEIGDQFQIGEDAVLELSKIGKECHNPCSIYQTMGDCIMPREGVFAKVLKKGIINIGDSVKVIKSVANAR